MSTPSPITYILLSPTFGMHQYTADLANRMLKLGPAGHVHLVTTTTYPPDRYARGVCIHAPVSTRGTGFSRESIDPAAYRRLQSTIFDLPSSTVHFTGVHLWNVPLAFALRRRGVRVIHTLHDLAPHSGVPHAGLIRLWNRLIVASGATILVHGRCYRDQLLRAGLPSDRVVFTPLLHGFWGWQVEERLSSGAAIGERAAFNPTADRAPAVIFFGRLEWYKGVDTLLQAWSLLQQRANGSEPVRDARLILAGRVAQGLTLPDLPPNVELRDRRIDDAEALDLFRQAALLVLPYRDATQTALIGGAARLGVPSLVTATGALPEYVEHGVTGLIAPPGDPAVLAAALARALVDPARLAQMGDAAHAWYVRSRQAETAALADLYCGSARCTLNGL